MKTPKANYKIFDTKLGSYVKRTKGKQTWNSESWALSAGFDHARDETFAGLADNSSRKQRAENYCLLYLEIHTFPIESAIVETWAARVEKNRAEAVIKKEKQAEAEYKRKIKEAERDIVNMEEKILIMQERLNKLKEEQNPI